MGNLPDERIELRDLDEARCFITQGLWLQRVAGPRAATVRPILDWCLEIAGSDQPLPPPGFIADLGETLFRAGQTAPPVGDSQAVPGVPAGLLRSYEDLVLGKVYADFAVERAGDALRRYEGRNRARGLAFVVEQLRERAGFRGVFLSPGVLKSLKQDPPQKVLAEGWDRVQGDGLMPLLVTLYAEMLQGVRRTAELLGPEDVFELEHGTALDELGQRLALRQVLHAVERLEASLPRHCPRPTAGGREVPTRVMDEDTYPVGGFASLSTRGSVESLLHSQLAFMEENERPDLFDVKYLRDELLYYARDENTFLRRRRTFVFVLFADLVQARFKDAELPWQRTILLLALMVVAVRRLTEWLSADALTFVFHFSAEDRGSPLAAERQLLQTLLREQIANGTVVLEPAAALEQVAQRCGLGARRSLCHGLAVSSMGRTFAADQTQVARLRLAGARPALAMPNEDFTQFEAEEAVASWNRALEALLEKWV